MRVVYGLSTALAHDTCVKGVGGFRISIVPLTAAGDSTMPSVAGVASGWLTAFKTTVAAMLSAGANVFREMGQTCRVCQPAGISVWEPLWT